MRPVVIMTASCKGGVGKTTVTANLALSLARLGHRTLMIDCDLGMRCLDIVSGLSDRVTYDVIDCAVRDISISRAAVRDDRCEGLYFIAAPYRYNGELNDENFARLIERAGEELDVEYVLLDTHGGHGPEFPLAAAAADAALIVTTHQEAALRAAEETQRRLADYGVEKTRLIVNCYDRRAAKREKLPGVVEMIDRCTVRLIGVVPYDPEFTQMQISGALAAENPGSPAGKAFCNIARRVCGENVKLAVI